MSGDLESVAIVGITHGFESFCHAFCVAVFTAGAYFVATGYWVPCGFSPFDFRFGHQMRSLVVATNSFNART